MKISVITLTLLILVIIPFLALNALEERKITTQNTPQTLDSKQIYLIALEDNGASGKLIGCNDSVVPYTASSSANTLAAILEELLSLKSQNIGSENLYNSLANSNLMLDKVTVVESTAYIELSGQIQLGGTCDTPRVTAQIEETAMQFPEVNAVSISLNGVPIEDSLSQR